jgi:hypothetical protein
VTLAGPITEKFKSFITERVHTRALGQRMSNENVETLHTRWHAACANAINLIALSELSPVCKIGLMRLTVVLLQGRIMLQT